MSFPLHRFEAISRRHLLHRSALVGGLAALAALPGVACGNDDDAQLGGLPSADSGAADTTSAPTAEPGGTAATTTTEAPPTDPFPAGAQLQVSFTYTAADGGGRVRNPYIAVWVEDASGGLVQTLSLWFKSNESKYLNSLKRWYNAESTLLDEGGTDNLDAIASATRTPGSYQVVWDGTDVDGNVVSKGNYVLCIESAREHGPYQIATGPLTIGAADFTTTLADSGELSAMVVTFVV